MVGLPDDYWGEIAVAVIAVKAGCTIDEGQILDYCSGRIARFSRPREVIQVDRLPRNAMGKIVKEDVRELAMRKTGRRPALYQERQPEPQGGLQAEVGSE